MYCTYVQYTARSDVFNQKYIKKVTKFGIILSTKRKSIIAEKKSKSKAEQEGELENLEILFEKETEEIFEETMNDWIESYYEDNPPKIIELHEPVYRYDKDGVIIENIYKPAILEHPMLGRMKAPTKTSVLPYAGRDELTNQPPEEPEVDRIRRFRECEAKKAQKPKVKPLTNKERDALYLKRFLESERK